ncbi:MAG: diguanylate cyclase, partial [Methylococcaceae bacterium]|nr:diguanylate cyclase [Methylococcaceae bacterium]
DLRKYKPEASKTSNRLLKMFRIKRLCIYSLVLVCWAVLTSIIIGLEYRLVLQKVEASFNQRVENLYESIEHIARDNEAILEGFSAFLGAIEYADRESASRYARQILANYPHVYQLEVILVVNRNELKSFISRQRNSWFPNFNVKAFNFSSGHTEKRIKKKPTFYPIIFIEPALPLSRQKIGADMESEPVLRSALIQAMKLKSTTATIPFNLVKGPREYALFHPVPDPPKGALIKRKKALAMLEVNADAIRKEIAPMTDNLEVFLYHANYSNGDSKGLLFHVSTPMPNDLEAKLFPKLTAERKLDRASQPFVLKVNRQLSWSDFEFPLLITTACTSLLSLALLLLFLSNHYRREEQRISSENRLRHMATHDALTGLPNRTLLADRFTQACSRAKRRNAPFSVMFLDLNEFKKINDNYGHEVGDQLLKSLGDLLKGCIRREDTLSRISGDEFVILLEDTPYEKAQQVVHKIQANLERPILVSDIELSISLSLGIAVYPNDGIVMSELLRTADERMYKAKRKNIASIA